jgi:hypothetical protein
MHMDLSLVLLVLFVQFCDIYVVALCFCFQSDILPFIDLFNVHLMFTLCKFLILI